MYIVLNKYTFRICILLHVKKHYFIDFCGLLLNHQKPSVYLQGFHVLFKHFLVVFHHKICVFIIFISFFDDVTNFRSAACDCMYASCTSFHINFGGKYSQYGVCCELRKFEYCRVCSRPT